MGRDSRVRYRTDAGHKGAYAKWLNPADFVFT
jgi:hypothetical protein